MRFLRFSYIVPRLLLFVVVFLATEVGSGHLLQWGLVAGGEAAVGARVDIGRVQSSLLESRMLVRDIAVANPHDPMRNLFEADRFEVDLNSAALLRKKLVAEYGVVSGLQFGTERDTSGALPARTHTGDDASAPLWVAPVANQYADAWLSGLESRLTDDLHQQFQSVRLAVELGQRWPRKYRQLEEQARYIQSAAKSLEQEVQTAKRNPLRHTEFLTQVPQRVAALRKQVEDLQSELVQLPDQLAADRAAIDAARKHDEEIFREHLELGSIDAKALSAYLLGEHITEPVRDAVGWVRWARKFVPSRGKVATDPPARGEDIVFANCEQHPSLLVKGVRLDGTARIGGQAVDLVGVVRDWTNQPELHIKPTTLELTTKGGLPLQLLATFDRTTNTPRDAVSCSTGDLLVPELSLGKQGKLQMALAPSRADVTLDLKIVEDQITGSVEIAQRGIVLTPTVAGGSLGRRLQQALAASFANIDQAKTTVVVSGTLNRPDFGIDSTLGTAIATAVNGAATDLILAERKRLLAESQQQVDAQVAKLNQEFAVFEQKLNAELKAPGDILTGLLPRGSDTEIGQSPFGQLFK